MLFHLYSPSAGGYVVLNGNSFTTDAHPVAGSLFDMCGPLGIPLDRGLRYNGDGTDFTHPDEYANTLEGEQTVTIRDSKNRFLTPRGGGIKFDANLPTDARFRIRKVSGSSGAKIRHGDMIALGALQNPPRDRYRWLQADPGSVVLGTAERTYGATQQFKFLEGNLLAGDATLLVSDRVPPGEGGPAGSLAVRLSHEGLINGSTVLVKFNALSAATLVFDASMISVPPAGGLQVTAAVPEGSNRTVFPMRATTPAANPCARFAGFWNHAPSPESIGSLTIVDRAMAAWASSGKIGTQPHLVDIKVARAKDYFDIALGASRAGANVMSVNDDGGTFIAAGDNTFTVTVQSGPQRLPRILKSIGYNISVTFMPFAAPNFGATTPLPTRVSGDPTRLVFNSDMSFTHTTTFSITPGTTVDMFCMTVAVSPGGPIVNPTRLARAYGLRVVP